MAFTVCIDSLDDGTYRVSVESPEQEAQEAAPAMPGAAPAMPAEGAQEAEPSGQVVKTVKDALTLALEALKNDGQMGDVASQAQDFNEGFGSPKQAMKPGMM